jgi:hypothetical protein
MSKKDYIILAEVLIDQIRLGYIKKKDIEKAIYTMGNALKRDNYKFSHDTFEAYIKKGLNDLI